MKAWLSTAFEPHMDTKAKHMAVANLPDRAARMEHRASLAVLPGGAELMSYERDLRDGEDLEPVGLP